MELPIPDDLHRMILQRIRPNVEAILNGRSDGPFTRDACLLNRFVVAQLINRGVIKYRSGNLSDSEFENCDDGVRVKLQDDIVTVQQVVVRHGPSNQPIEHFPALRESLQPARAFLRTYTAGVDRTRRPYWGSIAASSRSDDPALPTSTRDALAYIGQQIQSDLQQELVREGRLTTLTCESNDELRTISLTLSEQTASHDVAVRFTDCRIIVESGGKPSLDLPVDADPLVDAGRTLAILRDNAREIIDLSLGETCE